MSEEVNNPASDQLYHVKLLSALRSGDTAAIHSFLTEIGKDRRNSIDGDLDTGAAALHLAVRCATPATISMLLAHRAISPNGVHPPGSRTTPLHLAAALGRVDVVNLLLEQDGIDDSLKDSNGKTCKEVARSKDIVRAIDDSRSFLNASYRSLLHSYILSAPNDQPPAGLIQLLESPRVKFVDLSYLDNDSGFSLLHEAAKRKDLRLIELAVRAGADIFLRDRRGKMAHEAAGKDDRVKVFLRHTPTWPKATILFSLDLMFLPDYRHQDDETIASRGSISMKNAHLKVSERTRFEVSTSAARGQHHGSAQKWYLKANHPVEASRWAQALNNSIEWARQHELNADGSRKSVESERSGSAPSVSSLSAVPSIMKRTFRSRHASVISRSTSQAEYSDGGAYSGQEAPPRDEEEEDEEDDSASSTSDQSTLEITSQLLAKYVDSNPRSEAPHALKQSLAMAQDMLNEYAKMAQERDEFWKRQMKKEKKRQHFWEESLATVVKEGETLERELRKRSQKRGSRTFGLNETLKSPTARPTALSVLQPPQPADEPHAPLSSPDLPNAHTLPVILEPESVTTPHFPGDIKTPIRRDTKDTITPHSPPPPIPSTLFEPESSTSSSAISSSSATPPVAQVDHDTDEEDEFFDAIETGAIPNLVVPEALASPALSQLETPGILGMEPYAGYATLREQLSLDADNRPSTSLWSVLKHSIGKDLTKISFPVFFNEPTSMLQRMAEDMEFSECLDIAATEKDPLRRIAYVAAFAMSNYSSTLGRIAKPFNPMLSETFEYVRLDKQYRYVSEQVSHHPPISACWAESPIWHYYGEVDAQNKFMGKSFEIRPTGVAHADLLLPQEMAPHYPKSHVKSEEGKVIEHYSWKKVTTNISGFIIGSPTIDHYGDMVVKNHRTGDQCILTFKPRGWRGKDAYEVAGQVISAKGKVEYEIAGRWNSQLIMRPAGSSSALHPDLTISSPKQSEYILLWRNSEKPPGSPFNLTPYAITLNHCPQDTLRPFICPTDCRLRVDQRAFELGQYELANDLKTEQEEKQRSIRKAREEGSMPPHKPRWFTAETDGDTGDRVWTPQRVDDGTLEYWKERERVWARGGGQPWKDVDDIFVEEPTLIKDLLKKQ
ncbi:oxysterol-binding protein [Coprinopsis sp. MPI-PUGE-AT-0042]|nr:oxysterol-binding protein [Coprinopsis sp. MPI-PUGE-AT-0042]